MTPLLRSFYIFIRQIFKDSMLIVVLIAPILTTCFFRFGIPIVENLLCRYFNKATILGHYYLSFDLFISVITPYMFCFASAMVMLTEYDENMTSYFAVTPVGKKGYILSRLIFPTILSFFASIILLSLFSLTQWSFLMIVITCLLSCILSVSISLIIFSFSKNKVEGMAIAKLSGLTILGLIIPFFLQSDIQYLFSFLPSFWIAKLNIEKNIWFIFPSLIISTLWIWQFYRKFTQKL